MHSTRPKTESRASETDTRQSPVHHAVTRCCSQHHTAASWYSLPAGDRRCPLAHTWTLATQTRADWLSCFRQDTFDIYWWLDADTMRTQWRTLSSVVFVVCLFTVRLTSGEYLLLLCYNFWQREDVFFVIAKLYCVCVTNKYVKYLSKNINANIVS